MLEVLPKRGSKIKNFRSLVGRGRSRGQHNEILLSKALGNGTKVICSKDKSVHFRRMTPRRYGSDSLKSWSLSQRSRGLSEQAFC